METGTGGARVLVAADGVGPESEALAAEDIGPESEEVATEDVVDPLLSVDNSNPLLSVAQDSQEPDEVIVVLAADGMVPDSQEVAADGVALDSQEPDEGITPELLELPPDSMEVVLDSQEVAADGVALDSQAPDEGIMPELLELPLDSMDVVPDSMEVVPDSLPPGAFVCGRCGLVHEDREAWNRAHSRFHPCPSCGPRGLLHRRHARPHQGGASRMEYES